jgi:hypothetical protein
MKSIYYYLIFASTLSTSCGYAQKESEAAHNNTSDTAKNVISDKFEVLKFMADNNPCEASINTKYKKYKNKFNYPLSVFISVKLPEQLKSNLSNRKDSVLFNQIEQQIITNVASFSTCYIGNTNMNSYRDIIFYIKPTNKADFTAQIIKLKTKYPAITEFVFENDPNWEAVSEFYSALK